MYFSESMIGWQLVYEDGVYCLYKYCVLMNLFESFLDYQRGSSLIKIYIGMEQAKSPVF
jgi:hypothetical protein